MNLVFNCTKKVHCLPKLTFLNMAGRTATLRCCERVDSLVTNHNHSILEAYQALNQATNRASRAVSLVRHSATPRETENSQVRTILT